MNIKKRFSYLCKRAWATWASVIVAGYTLIIPDDKAVAPSNNFVGWMKPGLVGGVKSPSMTENYIKKIQWDHTVIIIVYFNTVKIIVI